MSNRPDDQAERRWWHDAIGYQVYIRSFMDSDGDGVGDLAGITSRLRHIADLGANTVWITPFYPSPMADFGYDVADYTGVDPMFGSTTDVEKLTAAAHELGLRVVIDLVPNHCSSAHRWFQAALADPESGYRDYFIWADPGPNGELPNNWVGYFGGPTWTLDENSGQYYLHMFLPEQPDLNWRNPAVLEEFDQILTTWLDRGVDGFRIDVAQALTKDPELRDNPQIAEWNPNGARWEQWDAFEHRHDVFQDDRHQIFERWKQLTDPRDALLIGETYILEADLFAETIVGEGLDVGFWFKPMHTAWDAAQVRDSIEAVTREVGDLRRVGWVTASHDEVRPPTRFGGGDVGRQRALTFATLHFCLPGMPFLYQGEELGLTEGVVPADRRADPIGTDVTLSRDGCRTPMPWSPGNMFGFTTAPDAWLPHGGRTDEDTVAHQASTDGSWLRRYQDLMHLRAAHPDLRDGAVEWLDDVPSSLIAFRRGPFVVVANLGAAAVELPVDGEVVFSSGGGAAHADGDRSIDPDIALVVRTTD